MIIFSIMNLITTTIAALKWNDHPRWLGHVSKFECSPAGRRTFILVGVASQPRVQPCKVFGTPT
jgi:hypothetical protein